MSSRRKAIVDHQHQSTLEASNLKHNHGHKITRATMILSGLIVNGTLMAVVGRWGK